MIAAARDIVVAILLPPVEGADRTWRYFQRPLLALLLPLMPSVPAFAYGTSRHEDHDTVFLVLFMGWTLLAWLLAWRLTKRGAMARAHG